MSLSRRRLLAGLTAVGGLGSLAGVGTAAYLTDRETLTGSYRTTELALDRSNLDVPLSFESLRYGVPTTQSVEIGLDDDSAAGWLWLRLCGGDTRLSRLLDAELTLVFPDGEETTFPDGGDSSLAAVVEELNDLNESTGADTESGAIRHGGGGSENVELTLTVTVPETDDAGELAYLRDGPNVVLTLSIHTEGADNNDASDSPWTADCPAGQELSEGPDDGDVLVSKNESGETARSDEPTTPDSNDEPDEPGNSEQPGTGNESGSGTQGGTQ
jgi:predicted ribosomally synthesized peptide with SipW-like signal peptide